MEQNDMEFSEESYDGMIKDLFVRFPSYQKSGAEAYKPGIANMEFFDQLVGHPHRKYPSVHVAGTNGKGSVCSMLASVLAAAGFRVGLYTSPHILDFRERMRIVDGRDSPSSPDLYHISKREVWDFMKRWRETFDHLDLSFFEITTSMAFSWFASREVDIAVIETGLGGRLDSTNIILPVLGVITNIGLDHCDMLGSTLPEIAFEKAGIIKTNTPVVVGETTDETRDVFLHKAMEMNSSIRFAEEEHEICSSRMENGFRIYKTLHWNEIKGELGGLCQEKNTATILAAVDELQKAGYAIRPENVCMGFENVCELTGLRGRWQQTGTSPLVVCDTGHNTGGIAYIAAQLLNLNARQLHVIIGMVNDKDIRGVLRLLPQSATYYFTKASVKRALDEHKLQELAREEGLEGSAWENVACAWKAARQNAKAEDAIFIGGSTFIVADFLTLQEQKEA